MAFESERSDALTSDDGLFNWSESATEHLRVANDGFSTIEDKKRNVCSCMFELIDCLKIPTKDDVGESFGAEEHILAHSADKVDDMCAHHVVSHTSTQQIVYDYMCFGKLGTFSSWQLKQMTCVLVMWHCMLVTLADHL